MLEVIIKDVVRSKLTVTPTRQVLKIPPHTPVDDERRLLRFSEDIVAQLFPTNTHSMRGQFVCPIDGKFMITLEDDSRKDRVTFVEK